MHVGLLDAQGISILIEKLQEITSQFVILEGLNLGELDFFKLVGTCH